MWRWPSSISPTVKRLGAPACVSACSHKFSCTAGLGFAGAEGSLAVVVVVAVAVAVAVAVCYYSYY